LAATIRRDVLAALVETVCSVVGGERLAEAERTNKVDGIPLDRYEAAVKVKPPVQANVSALFSPETHETISAATSSGERVAIVGDLLLGPSATIGPESARLRLLTETALRVASDPGSVPIWAGGSVEDRLEELLHAPEVMRAARYIVLATLATSAGLTTVYGGWSWP
jgi:hypothetical protein